MCKWPRGPWIVKIHIFSRAPQWPPVYIYTWHSTQCFYPECADCYIKIIVQVKKVSLFIKLKNIIRDIVVPYQHHYESHFVVGIRLSLLLVETKSDTKKKILFRNLKKNLVFDMRSFLIHYQGVAETRQAKYFWRPILWNKSGFRLLVLELTRYRGAVLEQGVIYKNLVFFFKRPEAERLGSSDNQFFSSLFTYRIVLWKRMFARRSKWGGGEAKVRIIYFLYIWKCDIAEIMYVQLRSVLLARKRCMT